MTSAIGSSFGSMAMQQMQRPDPGRMAEGLFTRLDTRKQGYIEKSDLESAFAKVSGQSGADVDEIFSQFDGDSDGKITKDEMSSGFRKLAEELDSQFNQMRMQGFGGAGGPGGMGGMPPPPRGGDAGFSKEELSGQLEETGTSDSQRSELIGSIVDNFDAADTDGDGKVSFKEAQAFKASQEESGNAAASSEARIMHRIMQLMQAYGGPGEEAGAPAAAGLLSVSA